MAEWLLYEHDDGRHAVAPSAEAATFAKGDPAWHRVGPVEVPDGLTRALQIVEAEISRAGALLNVEDGGAPVFDRAQTEAGIAALRTVAAAIEAERTAGRPACVWPHCECKGLLEPPKPGECQHKPCTFGVALPAPAQPDAWVPIHPRNGPLWSMVTDKPDPERLPSSYPLRPLVFADGVTAAPALEPLTNDEMVSTLDSAGIDIDPETAELIVRAVERAHGIDAPGVLASPAPGLLYQCDACDWRGTQPLDPGDHLTHPACPECLGDTSEVASGVALPVQPGQHTHADPRLERAQQATDAKFNSAADGVPGTRGEPIPPSPTAADMAAVLREAREAQEGLLSVIDAAGLHHLSAGVQLGQTAWFVKASDAAAYCRKNIAAINAELQEPRA